MTVVAKAIHADIINMNWCGYILPISREVSTELSSAVKHNRAITPFSFGGGA
jgi:hypothetical protein